MKSKSKIKTRYLFLLVLIIITITPFVWWYFTPSKNLDIVLMNKTFPLIKDDNNKITGLDYSKQRGLYWLIGHLGIENPSSKKTYDERKDYYGNFLDGEGLVNKPFEKLTNNPDVIFLSDMYGTGKSKINGDEPVGISGLTKEEIGLIATYYAKGTTVIGEYNIAGDPTLVSVSEELESVFGLHFTGVAGKFFSNLTAETDVPKWIRDIYEKQYGRQWDLEGGGIVVAGNDRIVVLQRDVDFIGKSIQIAMNKDFAGMYGTKTVDYYNWFEIVEPDENSKVLASYDLNLTKAGKKQLEPFGIDGKFPAIIEKKSVQQQSIYLAGDFTDYRGPKKIKEFTGAPTLYKYFSVSNEGDLSYFYWHFYIPFMSQTLKNIEPLEQGKFITLKELAEDETALMSKVVDGQFTVYENGKWAPMYVNGVNIGATVPGEAAGNLPTNPDFYLDWFQQIVDMNTNTIRVYTLMPSVFYRTLETYNYQNPNKKLYLLQNISVDGLPESGSYLAEEVQEKFERAIEDTVNVIHGNARIQKSSVDEIDTYVNDVSSYLLGYLIDSKLSIKSITDTDADRSKNDTKGEYITVSDNATASESWLASMSDKTITYEEQNYKMQHPIGIVSRPELDFIYQHLYGLPASETHASLNLNNIKLTDKAKSGIFGAYNVLPSLPGLTSEDDLYIEESFTGYKVYLEKLIKSQTNHPILISEFGISTGGPTTEEQQGEGIVSLINIIKASGAMGGVVYEWTDEWGKSSASTMPLMIPYKRGVLWHNTDDTEQNYGVVAQESLTPTNYLMKLRAFDMLNTLSLTTDESYFYIKADMNELPDFNTQKLMLFLDTIDRNNGEYLLEPDVTENWTGVEFKINITSEKDAELLVTPKYNASNGMYHSAITVDGNFERMNKQLTPEYVTKSGTKIEATVEDKSTLIPGDFENSDSHFYFDESTLYVRIPWSRLNFTDPSGMLALDDEKTKGLQSNTKNSIAVRMTDGVVPSFIVFNKETRKINYQFPESVLSSGYRTFTWDTWDEPKVQSRKKTSYDRIQKAYSN